MNGTVLGDGEIIGPVEGVLVNAIAKKDACIHRKDFFEFCVAYIVM